MLRKNFLFLYLWVLLLLGTGCNRNTFMRIGSELKNSKKARQQPYLILISMDGYRWDYTARFQPRHISEFIANGAQAESMIPSFPSKTFPNHYTIATGMYPDNNGLLDNSFYNFEKKEIYRIRDRDKVEDGTWYSGTPIWVQAAKAGMVSASFFFVGSEADVQGVRPNYYFRYDSSIPNKERVRQVLKWLRLPAAKRPHLITLYFSDIDNAGHRFGPNDDFELKKALLPLDETLGELFAGIKKTKLPVNVILVSDHGMMEIPAGQYMPVEMIEDDEHYITVNNGAIVHIYPRNPAHTDSLFAVLKSKEKHFKVYKTENTPQFEYVPKNKNWGAIQIVADKGWYFTRQRYIGLKKAINGEHGFDPEYKDMHAIFYANGPNIKKGTTIPSFKNIHLYPLMCKILGLDIPENIDGKQEVLEKIWNE